MKKLIFLAALLLLGLNIKAQDLESVLEKCNAALQLDKRANIQSLETNGYFVMRDTEANIPYKLIQQKPGMIRVETSLFGFKAIQTYDGEKAWLLTPTQGMEAKETNTRDMEFIAMATALDGPFNKELRDTYKIIYGGKESYRDSDTELIVLKKDDEKVKYFIDAKAYTITGIRYEYKKNGAWYSMEYLIKSYQDYLGSKFPKEVTALVNGVEMIFLHITDLKKLGPQDEKIFGKPRF